MKLRNCLAILIATILIGVSMHAIADDATTIPSDESHASRSRVGSPFNKLQDLTDDQKAKIKEIRSEASEQEKQIRQKEMDDITALLTDDQKKELSDIEAKDAIERKAGSAERRAKTEEEKAEELKQQAEGMGGATTQPAGQ
jgi:Spy/CpxP family protein refolding chaperone